MIGKPARPYVALLLLPVAVACGRASPPSRRATPRADARSLAGHSPQSRAELPTTSGAIAVGNLEAQIAGLERLLGAGANPKPTRVALVSALLLRGQTLGRIADYERAETLADEIVRQAPADGEARLARASVRATFHRFAEALADLGEAEKGGIADGRVEEQRAAILQATGRLDEALELRRLLARLRPKLRQMAAEATVLADRGEPEAAERRFIEAQRHFVDVNPFPLAWLYLQEGLMWQKQGRPARARELYQAACERLPAYAPAASHLAAVLGQTGDRARAIEILRPLAGASDDPEYAEQLSVLLRDDGQAAEADRLHARAAARYAALLARHPDAFADHAARFYLGPAAEPARALALAERNFKNRPTADARQLLIEAALAARAPARACAVAEAASAASHPTASLHVAAARAFAACGRPDRAQAEKQAALGAQPVGSGSRAAD